MAEMFPGADGRRRVTGARTFALAVLIMMVAAGCRDSTVYTLASPPAGPPGIVFAPGDSLTFDSWALDDFGDRIPSSLTGVLWRVADTGGTAAGRSRVTTVIEGTAPGFPPLPPDTLLFQFRADGDIFQYAFLAKSVLRRESRVITPQWDRIAAFSLPAGGIWTVGAQDSAGTDLVQGRVLDDQSYFSISVNGVEMLFRGYSATMVGTNYQYGLSIAVAPPAVLVLREEPGPMRNGRLQLVNMLRLHTWP